MKKGSTAAAAASEILITGTDAIAESAPASSTPTRVILALRYAAYYVTIQNCADGFCTPLWTADIREARLSD